jgi:c-di-GMP-binding flagellar brake protein YcgR
MVRMTETRFEENNKTNDIIAKVLSAGNPIISPMEEKRENIRRQTTGINDLYSNVRIGKVSVKLPIVDISIGGMCVLVTDGFSLFKEGRELIIENLEKDGVIIAAEISGKVAYIGPGVPSRAGIEFSPQDTPIEAYTKLRDENAKNVRVIKGKDKTYELFSEIKRWSRGFGDILMIHKSKAIPAEFFYLRPDDNNMVLRIVRISELRLPFEPQAGKTYTFYLFKGINVMVFTAKVVNIIKNILETTWPEEVTYISRRSMARYLITGNEPLTAQIIHPISSKEIPVVIWDISIEGMGAEILEDETPVIEGMNLPLIKLNLPKGDVEGRGIVRSVRTENVLQKTQLGIEFINGTDRFRDKILEFILDMNLPSDEMLKGSA